MKPKILLVTLVILLIAPLFGFWAAQAQSDLDTVTCPPSYEELLTTIEIFSTYANQQLETTLLYRDEIARLEAQKELLIMRKKELQYAESVQCRLAWWLHLEAIKAQNSK